MNNFIGFIFGLIYVGIAVLMIVSMWKMFEKANKPGWAAIVPIYNMVILLEMIGKPWWWIILMLVPLVNIVVLIIVWNEVSKAFGQGGGFTLGLIFLPFIFIPMIAFNDEIKYVGPSQEAGTGPLQV